MRRRRWGSLVALFLVTASVLAACGDDGDGSSDSADRTEEPVRGGTLVFATDQEVAGWAPWQLRGSFSGEDRGQLVFDSLLQLGPDLSYKPNIAEEMTSSDGITWKMRLRPGVKFSDGTPLDADAVIFNVEQSRLPETDSSIRTLVSGVASMRAVDPLNVEFVLRTANGSFPDSFTRIPGQMASPTAFKADPRGFSTKPIGAGPFLMESWLRDSKAVLVRNPNYWQAGRPYLDRVEIRVLPDAVTRGQSLVAGEVDMVVDAGPVQQAIKGDKTKVTNPNTGAGHMFVVPNQGRAPWTDLRLRQAISMAFDRKLMNDSLLSGSLPSPIMPCPPFKSDAPECNPSAYTGYDVTKAKALVQEYVREKGPLPTFQFVTFAARRDVAEYVQQSLREVGINVNLEILQTPEWTARYQAGDCDLCMNEIVSVPRPANSLYLNFHSTQRHGQKGVKDPELDRVVEQQLFALTPEARLDAAKKTIDILSKQAIATFVSPTLRGSVTKSTVHLGDALVTGGLVGQNIWKSS